MTTDITELAQREKFEAWARSQQLSIAYGDCGYVYSSTEMAWRAVKALSAELVEALEKSEKTSEARREAIDITHKRATRERGRANAAEEALEKAQSARDEYEAGERSAAVKSVEQQDEIYRLNARIADLEASHAKLRDAMAAIHNTIRTDGAYTPLAAILNAAKRAHEESASAAGIKWEGE